MKLTQDRLDFVAQCVVEGDPGANGAVYVDVARIGERFDLSYPTALKLMRHCLKKLGHTVVSRNLVKAGTSDVVQSTKRAAMIKHVEELMRDIAENGSN